MITNGTIISPADSLFVEDGAVLVEDGKIKAIGARAELEPQAVEMEKLDAHGGLIMPGLICAHGHFYGAFARGMPVAGPAPSNFVEILEKLWWKVDKALTMDDIKYSALVCLVSALRCGTTTIFDHHASPNAIEGSLDVIAKAAEEVGVRTCLCYEVSDRDGPEAAQAGIDENVRFLRRCKDEASPMRAAAFGLHASFTIGSETMTRCVEAGKEFDAGFHVHTAEDAADQNDSHERYGKPVVNRLNDSGALNGKSMAVHCVHTVEDEWKALADSGTFVVHCPESNMNNGVGVAQVPEMRAAGVNVALGTDGYTFDMLAEFKAAYVLHKLAKRDPRAMPANELVDMLFGTNAELAERHFGLPIGRLRHGAPADVITLDYNPPTPLSLGNFPWHLNFGLDSSMVRNVVVGGKSVLKDRAVLGVDEAKLAREASKLAAEMWKRMEK